MSVPPLGGRIVAVAGTGLIGASVGLAAGRAGARVRGWDPDPAALGEAAARGAVADPAPDLAALTRGLGARDVLVLAAPVEATLALLERFATADPPGAGLVLDVASVKGRIAALARLPARFVPSHPIAGSERSGPAAARPDLFDGKTWTLDADADPAARSAAADFVRALGAVPLDIRAPEHDAVLAFTSHLPQLLAIALGEELAGRLDDPAVKALTGTGMGSMTRLGASPWSMWRGIVAENSAQVTQELRSFAAILAEIADEIESGDAKSLEGRFAAAARAARQLGRDGNRGSGVEREKKATHTTTEDEFDR